MKKEYLKYLKCPKCGSKSLKLRGSEKEDERIKSGSIDCNQCETNYPITNYIPRFSVSTPYADSFGPQWRSFATSQIDTDQIRESNLRFDSEIGWSENDIKGKSVVEYGSGAGRFVDIVSQRGAHLIIGLDATDAVDAAQSNLQDRKNVLFVQGDIFLSPIRNNSVDFGYSIGVLHHTPDPEDSFRKLLSTIKPLGNIAVSLYEVSQYQRPNLNSLKVSSMELLWALNAWRSEIFRTITSRVPSRIFLMYCKIVVPILHVINKIPVLRYFRYLLPSTCYRNLPVIWSMVDTHDTYVTKIVHQYTGRDVFQWFLHEGLTEIILRNSRAGWVSITGVVGDIESREKNKMFLEQLGAPHR